jgi:DNA-binding transcriptional regulator YdaS (Cro superfamily)
MNTAAVIALYGSKSAIAQALGITKQALSRWGESVPLKWALVLERITDGELQVTDEFLEHELSKISRTTQN